MGEVVSAEGICRDGWFVRTGIECPDPVQLMIPQILLRLNLWSDVLKYGLTGQFTLMNILVPTLELKQG